MTAIRSLSVLPFLLATAADLANVRAQDPPRLITATPAPFPLELAMGLRAPSREDRPSLRPDGRFVAYSITADPPDSALSASPSVAPAQFRGLRLYVVDTTNGLVEWISDAHRSAWAPSWSPDGTTVAFYAEDGHEVGLWCHRVGDDAARRLGTAVVSVGHTMRPEWAPDATHILIPTIAPSARSGRELAPDAATEPAAVATAAVPLGVVVRATGDERADARAPSAPTVGPDDPAAPAAPATQSLVSAPAAALSAVRVADGRVSTILPAGDQPRFLSAKLSPSGKFLACEQSLRATFTDGLAVLMDVEIVRRADGATLHRAEGIALDVNIDPNSPTLAAMVWHPTQDRFAYLNDEQLVLVDLTTEPASTRTVPLGERVASANHLASTTDGGMLLVSVRAANSTAEDPFLARILAIPTGAGPTRELLPPEGVKLRAVIAANWRTAWQPQPNRLIASGTDTSSGERLFLSMPLVEGSSNVVRRVDGSLVVVAAQERGHAVALVENVGTAPDFFLVGADLAPSQRLSRSEPRLEGVVVGPAESFATEIEGIGERRSARAVVAMPEGRAPGERLPTIVTLYPGMELSGQASAFGGGDVASIPAAVFTTRGYAVLVLDVPLAPFGVPSHPLRDIRTTVLAQVARAVELGYTDPDRVAVIGHSYGGYGAACLVCGTRAFRAAVAVSGFYDLAGSYAAQRVDEPETDGLNLNMEYFERHQGRMGLALWDDPQRYLDNSPYFQAATIDTPLLLLHGTADDNCRAWEAEKMFNARKRLGGSAQLALYAGEGHVPAEWSRAHRLDVMTRTLEFFARHLRAEKGSPR